MPLHSVERFTNSFLESAQKMLQDVGFHVPLPLQVRFDKIDGRVSKEWFIMIAVASPIARALYYLFEEHPVETDQDVVYTLTLFNRRFKAETFSPLRRISVLELQNTNTLALTLADFKRIFPPLPEFVWQLGLQPDARSAGLAVVADEPDALEDAEVDEDMLTSGGLL